MDGGKSRTGRERGPGRVGAKVPSWRAIATRHLAVGNIGRIPPQMIIPAAPSPAA
jgi:hypothetical protein